MKARHTASALAIVIFLFCLALVATARTVKGQLSSQLGKLAYIAEGNLWVRALPDGEPKQLTSGGGNNTPRWSPSGEWIALRRGDGRIWVLRDTGEGATSLQDIDSAGMYAWSPVTDTLALTAPNGNLSIASAPDWRAQPVAAVQGEQGHIFPFAWSPDGAWLAFSEWHSLGPAETGGLVPRYASLQKVRPDGRDRTELLNAGSPSDDGLELAGWSRDAQQIYYWSDPMFSASLLADGTELRAVAADGSQATRAIAPTMLLYDDFWSESPDGKSLAVTIGGGRETWSEKRIALVDRSNGQLTRLTEVEAAFSPAWSPDGERLAYVAASDIGRVGGGPTAKAGIGERRIWIMNKDGSSQHALTGDSTYRDEFPQWSRDGRFVLFASLNAADEASVWLVPSSGGPPQQVAAGLNLDPLTTWFGYYGHIDWTQNLDWWKGPLEVWNKPLNPITPAANWALYRDPVLGFSLQYPANWKVDGSTASPSQAAPQGTSVRIRNYEDAVRKGGFTPDQLMIYIAVFPELPQYGTLENWVAKRPLYQDASYGPQKEIKVGGIRALSWTVTGPTAPEGALLIALAKDKWVYLISAHPATSKHLATFDHIVSTLQIP